MVVTVALVEHLLEHEEPRPQTLLVVTVQILLVEGDDRLQVELEEYEDEEHTERREQTQVIYMGDEAEEQGEI